MNSVVVDIESSWDRRFSTYLTEGIKKFSLWLFLNMVSGFLGYHLSGGFEGFLLVLVSGLLYFWWRFFFFAFVFVFWLVGLV